MVLPIQKANAVVNASHVRDKNNEALSNSFLFSSVVFVSQICNVIGLLHCRDEIRIVVSTKRFRMLNKYSYYSY